ncbi:MAG: PfkB family carbohydrate kinase [Roseovarius sp.]
MSTILCIGSVLWDVIGTCGDPMDAGADRPGHITRHPGGVALNVAMALKIQGLSPALLSAVGRDDEGHDLIRACDTLGLQTAYIHRPKDLPTDRYMAIEDPRGLVAAIAHAHTLEATGAAILTPLRDGRLGDARKPFTGLVALDGNLTHDLLADMSQSPLLARADLRVAPASPGKALRLRPFVPHDRAVLYVNLQEACTLADATYATAHDAAQALLSQGAARVLVTDGPRAACDGDANGMISATPPTVTAARITGAGDTFMATHIAAELSGADRQSSLSTALSAAATHVSGSPT